MKKIVFLLVMSALLLVSCDSEPKENMDNDDVIWVEEEGDSITESEHYKYEYDKDGNQIRYKVESEYDKKGNEILELWYDDEGNVHKKIEYEYDGNGNKTLCAYYDETGNIYRKFEYTYDSKGNEKTCKESNYKDGIIRSQVEEDQEGNKLLDVDYDAEGIEVYRYESQRDNKGNITSSVIYRDGLLEEKTVYEYNVNGDRILEIRYDAEGKETYKEKQEYDVKGEKTAQLIYKDEKLETKYEFENNKTTVTKYYKNGDISSVEVMEQKDKERINSFYDKDGNMTARYVYKYDDNGKMIFESYENFKKESQNYQREYKYDSEGNCIETIDSRNS